MENQRCADASLDVDGSASFLEPRTDAYTNLCLVVDADTLLELPDFCEVMVPTSREK